MVDPTWTTTCPACGYEDAKVNHMGQMYGHEAVTGCPHSGSAFRPLRERIYPLKFDVIPAINATLAYDEDGTAATIRLEMEYPIESGDHLSLRTPEDTVFGIGEVMAVYRGEARLVLREVWDSGARYPVGSLDELISTLTNYYEHAVYPDTEVEAFIYAPEITGFAP